MGIISKGNRSKIAAYLKAVELRNGDSFVKVVCTSNAGGKTVRDVMKQYWEAGDGALTGGAYFYSPDENGGNSPWGWWKEFSVRPMMPSPEREQASIEIKKELAAIIEGVSDGSVTPASGTGAATETPAQETAEDPVEDPTKKKLASYTTYLIIGAAAVVILLLLWDRKRK